MYFRMSCPRCQKGLKVPEEYVGKKVRCPYCQQVFEMPAVPAAAPPPGEQAGPTGVPPEEQATGLTSEHRRLLDVGSDSTNVSLMLTGVAAVGLTAVFYLAVILPLNRTYIGQLFAHRGWVQYAIVFLSWWAAGILFLKSRRIRRQKASLFFDVLPAEIAQEIRPDNVDLFRRHIRDLPCVAGLSFLLSRVLRALDHFKSRRSVQEVALLLESQGDLDANAVESSYSMIGVLIWAIPILGFIGTVMGIGQAVGSFSGSIKTAAGVDIIKQSLGDVTAGLAVAFDTTFLALIMSLLIMFPSRSMQKAEEDLLNSVGQYCNENLLRRLDDGGAGGGLRPDDEVVRNAVSAAVMQQEAVLRRWSDKLQGVGNVVAQQVAEGWGKICHEMQEHQEAHVAKIQSVLEADLVASVRSIGETAERVQREIARQLEEVRAAQNQGISGAAARLDEVAKVGNGLVASLADCQRKLSDDMSALRAVVENHQMFTTVQEALARNLELLATSDSFKQTFAGLDRALNRLNPLLADLNQRAGIIWPEEPGERKSRRGFWRRLTGRGGRG